MYFNNFFIEIKDISEALECVWYLPRKFFHEALHNLIVDRFWYSIHFCFELFNVDCSLRSLLNNSLQNCMLALNWAKFWRVWLFMFFTTQATLLPLCHCNSSREQWIDPKFIYRELVSSAVDKLAEVSSSSTFRCIRHSSMFRNDVGAGTAVAGTNLSQNEELFEDFINIF